MAKSTKAAGLHFIETSSQLVPELPQSLEKTRIELSVVKRIPSHANPNLSNEKDYHT